MTLPHGKLQGPDCAPAWPRFGHFVLPQAVSITNTGAVAPPGARMTAVANDRAEVFARIIELIEPLNPKKIALGEDTSFAGDLEMDSLTVMDLVASMEDEWDIVMPLNMLPDLETVGQVADAVTKLVSK
jgi:acyl carrier protein